MAYEQDMKAFWLTTDGRLVYVDRLSEDSKFRYLRQRHLRVVLSLWTTNPELCVHAIRASGSAHHNLIKIFGEAARLSQGRFYNLYANYPLPTRREGHWEVRNGGELLLKLQPLYAAYFSFITDNCTFKKLRKRVLLLGAQWLVQEDSS